MCRNITTLRGLEPAATPEEIEAAARQYVRKVSGVQARRSFPRRRSSWPSAGSPRRLQIYSTRCHPATSAPDDPSASAHPRDGLATRPSGESPHAMGPLLLARPDFVRKRVVMH